MLRLIESLSARLGAKLAAEEEPNGVEVGDSVGEATSGGRAPLGRLRHTWTSCASKASLERTGVARAVVLISPYSGT